MAPQAERGVRGGGNTIRELQPAGRPGLTDEGDRGPTRREGGAQHRRAGRAGMARAPGTGAPALTSRTVPDR
ncbi:hypothetical protein KGM_207153 [Danaus plexippus plexippus]|uniref:Uncharacterized protein n=1 Tax=Danaus plexippus plexippus TaxID=278856 RepID=A0A212FMC4_DANPL|nr:hypothetical protein KGM_207153 [Danaus plexippus plexippus]